MIHPVEHIPYESNVWVQMRERGKLVQGSQREGHNVSTVTGRNLLSRLLAWHSIGSADGAVTQRRVRWVGVGSGSQLEVTTVTQLAQAVIARNADYLVPLHAPATFPGTTSVEFRYEFSPSEISTGGVPVVLSEVGLFADVNPASAGGVEDSAASGVLTTLNPTIATNPPIAYKAFDPITKTKDFTLEVRWTFRF